MPEHHKREKEQYLDIINQVAIITRTDLKGVITYANDIFCEISGYTKEELIGKPHNIIRHPDEPATTYEKMWSSIQKGEVFKGRLKNRAKDGSTYHVFAYIFPIFDDKDDSQIIEYMGIRFLTTEEEEARLRYTMNLRRTFIKQKMEKSELHKEVDRLMRSLEYYTNGEKNQILSLQEEIKALEYKLQREKVRADNMSSEALQYKERLNKVNEYIRKMINNR